MALLTFLRMEAFLLSAGRGVLKCHPNACCFAGAYHIYVYVVKGVSKGSLRVRRPASSRFLRL